MNYIEYRWSDKLTRYIKEWDQEVRDFPTKVHLEVRANGKDKPAELNPDCEQWGEMFTTLPEFEPKKDNENEVLMDYLWDKCKDFVNRNVRKWFPSATRAYLTLTITFDTEVTKKEGKVLFWWNGSNAILDLDEEEEE